MTEGPAAQPLDWASVMCLIQAVAGRQPKGRYSLEDELYRLHLAAEGEGSSVERALIALSDILNGEAGLIATADDPVDEGTLDLRRSDLTHEEAAAVRAVCGLDDEVWVVQSDELDLGEARLAWIISNYLDSRQ